MAIQKPRRLKVIYAVTPQQQNTSISDNVNSNSRIGILVNTGSCLAGRTVYAVAFLLRQETGTATGTFTYTVRDNSDAIVSTLATFNCNILPTTNAKVMVVASGFTPVKLSAAVLSRILCEYSGGDATHQLSLSNTTSNVIDANISFTRYNGSYTNSASANTVGYVWTA